MARQCGKKLQVKLLGADGRLRSATEKALRDYQTKIADGMAGPATLARGQKSSQVPASAAPRTSGHCRQRLNADRHCPLAAS
jgi:hypothetical protein